MVKTLPKPVVRYTELAALPYEALKWEVLKTGVELELFDHLKKPTSSKAIAAKLSLHPENTERLLNALAALGYLSKTKDLFRNSSLAETCLTQGGDTYLGRFLLLMESWNNPILNGGMRDFVQNGPPPPKHIEDEEIWKNNALAGLNEARCGRAQNVTNHVASLPEFPFFKRILDLGAGSGIMGIAVASSHPSLQCRLFDQPAVCNVADEVIGEYGMGERVKTVRGDYMKDPIGENYDFIMANFTLNFYREKLDEIMSKVFRALNPGGLFMVTSDGLTEERTAPVMSVISWLSAFLAGDGYVIRAGKNRGRHAS